MKSVCVTKAKAYYIIADGYTECYTFNSRFEYMFILSKGRPKTLNLLCDRKNKSAGNVSNCETRSGREQRRTLSKKELLKNIQDVLTYGK